MIQSEEPDVWTFVECAFRSSGNRPLDDWYENKLSEEGKFLFDALLKTNHKTKDHREWQGFRGFLKGKAEPHRIWELGFRADGCQYRVFGIFRRNVRRQAILLVGCYHKMGIYMPPKAIKSACELVKEIERGRVDFYERKINSDL
jgi:hypothetical protein